MGEGPKDLRDDAGRFDAPRNDDMVGRGEPDIVGRGTAGAEPLTPAGPRTAYEHRQHGRDSAVMSTARDNPNASDSTDTTPETAEIRAEIEQKRAEISETIDEITPAALAGEPGLAGNRHREGNGTRHDAPRHRNGQRHGAARGRERE